MNLTKICKFQGKTEDPPGERDPQRPRDPRGPEGGLQVVLLRPPHGPDHADGGRPPGQEQFCQILPKTF